LDIARIIAEREADKQLHLAWLAADYKDLNQVKRVHKYWATKVYEFADPMAGSVTSLVVTLQDDV
jgi:hypothetical protein